MSADRHSAPNWRTLGDAAARAVERLLKLKEENGTRREAGVPSPNGSGSGELGRRLLSKRPNGFEPRRFHQPTQPGKDHVDVAKK
jgi:hypothetical protein